MLAKQQRRDATWAAALTLGLQTLGVHWPWASQSEFPASSLPFKPAATSTSAATHTAPQRFKFTFTYHTHARKVLPDPGESRDRGKGELVRTRRSGRSSVPPGPAPTCRPRVRGLRRQRPVLAEDEFEVELVVSATVCSSHRRGPGSCGSSSGVGDGDGCDGSSAPLHAGPRRPGGRDSATNFPGGDRDFERTVPNYRAGRAQNRTRSWRHCQSLVPKPPQWL